MCVILKREHDRFKAIVLVRWDSDKIPKSERISLPVLFLSLSNISGIRMLHKGALPGVPQEEVFLYLQLTRTCQL